LFDILFLLVFDILIDKNINCGVTENVVTGDENLIYLNALI